MLVRKSVISYLAGLIEIDLARIPQVNLVLGRRCSEGGKMENLKGDERSCRLNIQNFGPVLSHHQDYLCSITCVYVAQRTPTSPIVQQYRTHFFNLFTAYVLHLLLPIKSESDVRCPRK